MTRLLSVLCFSFVTTLLLTGAALFLTTGPWVAMAGIVASLVMSVVILYLWARAVRKTVIESYAVLKKTPDKSMGIANGLSTLSANHAVVSRKFAHYAKLIASLAKPDECGLNDEELPDDSIDQALREMRLQMSRVRSEEEQRNWVTNGLAKFAVLLRDKHELKVYGANIISNLVKYVSANQGALYIERTDEEGNRCLGLLACYAYDKHRIRESQIALGEGVLGQCMLEKELVLLKDVPPNYVKITSGLGEATPRNVVVSPLLFNSEFYGAVELITFEQFKPHHIEFIREVCQSIAAEISSLQGVARTEKLLSESNMLAEKLKAREGELNHHLDTISSTQQEMARKQAELAGTISAIDGTLATANFDLDGNFIGANEIFLRVLGYDQHSLMGKHIGQITGGDASVKLMWENLRLGKSFAGEFRMRDHLDNEMWLSGTFNPIIVEGSAPQRILMLAQFTTQEKEKLNDLNGMVLALKATLPILEFNADLTCKSANDKALKLFQLTRMNMRTKKMSDFLTRTFLSRWDLLLGELQRTDSIQANAALMLPGGERNYEIGISMTKDTNGRVTRIVIILVRVVDADMPMVA